MGGRRTCPDTSQSPDGTILGHLDTASRCTSHSFRRTSCRRSKDLSRGRRSTGPVDRRKDLDGKSRGRRMSHGHNGRRRMDSDFLTAPLGAGRYSIDRYLA